MRHAAPAFQPELSRSVRNACVAFILAVGMGWGSAAEAQASPSVTKRDSIVASPVPVSEGDPVRCAPANPMPAPWGLPSTSGRVPRADAPRIPNACPTRSGARTVVTSPTRVRLYPFLPPEDPL
jgi:hypothetical protein